MPTVSDILSGPPHWLVEMRIGGRWRRFADVALTVYDEDGASYQYESGLTSPTQLPTEVDRVAVTVESPDDWALDRARGHALERQPAVVRRWHEGTTLEDAELVLEGVLEGVAIGSVTDPFGADVVREGATSYRQVPDTQAVVADVTWPVRTATFALEARAQGQVYPHVIGCPGHAPDLSNPLPAVPVPMVEYALTNTDSRVLVNDEPADASMVRLWWYDSSTAGDSSRDATVVTQADLLDRPTAVAIHGGTVNVAAEAQWYAGFQDDSTYGGGARNRARTGPLRGLGEVFRDQMERYSSEPVDVGRLESESVRLDTYKIDWYLNQPSNIAEALRSVLAWMPVELRRSQRGLWLQHWRWDASAKDAVGALDADAGAVYRESLIAPGGGRVYNEFSVRFRRYRESQWQRTRVLSAQTGQVASAPVYGIKADSRVTGSALCRASQSVYGVQPRPLLQAPWLYDDPTAAQMLQQWALAYCFPRDTLTYRGPLELSRYQPGDVLLLTDSELYLADALAVVGQPVRDLRQVVLPLTLLNAPGRGSRRTS